MARKTKEEKAKAKAAKKAARAKKRNTRKEKKKKKKETRSLQKAERKSTRDKQKKARDKEKADIKAAKEKKKESDRKQREARKSLKTENKAEKNALKEQNKAEKDALKDKQRKELAAAKTDEERKRLKDSHRTDRKALRETNKGEEKALKSLNKSEKDSLKDSQQGDRQKVRDDLKKERGDLREMKAANREEQNKLDRQFSDERREKGMLYVPYDPNTGKPNYRGDDGDQKVERPTVETKTFEMSDGSTYKLTYVNGKLDNNSKKLKANVDKAENKISNISDTYGFSPVTASEMLAATKSEGGTNFGSSKSALGKEMNLRISAFEQVAQQERELQLAEQNQAIVDFSNEDDENDEDF